MLNEVWQVCMSRGGAFKKVAHIDAHESRHPNQTKLEVDGENAFNSACQIKIMALVSDQETDNDVASINLKDKGDDADDDDDVDPDYDDDDYDDG